MPICRSLHPRRRSKSGLRTSLVKLGMRARIGQKNGLVRQWARRGTRLDSPQTNATRAPISSTPSAQPKARARRWRCRLPTPRRCSPSRGNQPQRRCRRACRASLRPRRLAHHALSRHAREHHADLAAFARARTQSRGERLAVPAPDLAVQPRLRDLRRHRPCRMRSLDQWAHSVRGKSP
jgi:hypothetical protein